MLLDDRPYTFDRVIRIGVSVALLWALVRLLGYLSDVLIPFAVALLLAYLLNPLVQAIQKRVPYHGLAVGLCLCLVAVLIGLVFWLIMPLLMHEIEHMGQIVSALITNSELAAQAAKRLPPDLWQVVKEYVARPEVQQLFTTENVWQVGQTVLHKVVPGVWGVITGAASVVTGLVGLAVIGLYLVFLLLDYQQAREGWKALLPPTYRGPIIAFVREFDIAMNRYFRAQAEVAAIVGVLFATGFWLIGLPLGVLLGLFIGVLNMVPYLQILGFIPAFALALIHALETGSSVWAVFGLTTLVFVVVQMIQDTILVPKIMGRVTGLSPAMILLSLSIWGKLLGIFGLLIALPMTCLLLAYYQRFLTTTVGTESSPPSAVSG